MRRLIIGLLLLGLLFNSRHFVLAQQTKSLTPEQCVAEQAEAKAQLLEQQRLKQVLADTERQLPIERQASQKRISACFKACMEVHTPEQCIMAGGPDCGKNLGSPVRNLTAQEGALQLSLNNIARQYSVRFGHLAQACPGYHPPAEVAAALAKKP